MFWELFLKFIGHCRVRFYAFFSTTFVVNRFPAIYVISSVGEKNCKIKIVSSFSAIKLCFVNQCVE